MLHSIAEIHGKLTDREISARELLSECMRAAAEKNSLLNAFITFDPGASVAADGAQKMIDAGEAVPLTGIPYGVKDNFCTAGVRTTCASKMLSGFVPDYDAECIEAIRAARGVMVGKTNMDEFGMGSDGSHSAFGPVLNPADPSRSAGGSSSGSAAAVASGMCIYALGSDTGGSVRAPASYCGVVGLKPTYGRISRYGLTAFASSLDCPGILAGCVDDAETVLRSLASKNEKDASAGRFRDMKDPRGRSRRIPEKREGDRPFAGVRLAIIRENTEGPFMKAEAGEAFRDAAGILAAAGAEIDIISVPEMKNALEAYYIISSAEAASNLARFDGTRYGLNIPASGDVPYSFAEQIAVNREAGFGSEVKKRIGRGYAVMRDGTINENTCGGAYAARERIIAEYSRIFGQYDAVIQPAMPSGPVVPGSSEGSYASDVLTVPASLAGIPAISVPMKKTRDGLLLGLELECGWFAEALLLELSRRAEKII